MNLRRFLHPESIQLDLLTLATPDDLGDDTEDFDPHDPTNLRRIRESVTDELCALLDRSGNVANPRRLAKELLQREKQTASGVGSGIAIPHIRTMQARSFTIAFGRSVEGLPWETHMSDVDTCRLFFAMVAPPHDDRTYLRIYRAFAKSLLDREVVDQLLEIEDAGEVLRVLKNLA